MTKLPVYDHLATVYPQLDLDQRSRTLKALQRLRDGTQGAPERLLQFLDVASVQLERELLQRRLAEAIDRAADLTSRREFVAAASTLTELDEEVHGDERFVRALTDVRERWSVDLEGRAATLADADDSDAVRRALQNLRKALQLTTRVERIGVLQQKISAIETALGRQESSVALKACYTELRAGHYDTVLERLAQIDAAHLPPGDVDLFHYIAGSAHFRSGQWSAAAASLAQVERQRYADHNYLLGLALVRSGQHATGCKYLLEVPDSSVDDPVRRALSMHAAKTGNADEAVRLLGAVKDPTTDDFSRHAALREQMGRKAFDAGDYAQAIESLRIARDLLVGSLGRSAIAAEILLAHSYYHLDDLDAAKTIYDELTRRNLPRAELERIRDLFLYRGKIALDEGRPDESYASLQRFVELGGAIPKGELERQFARLTATYANFMPLARIHHWQYLDTTSGKNHSLFVKAGTDDNTFDVERREDQTSSNESWHIDGRVLIRTVGKDVWRVPINLEPSDATFPKFEATRMDGAVTYTYNTEIEAYGETVELPDADPVTGCLKVVMRRTREEPGKKTAFLVYTVYLAPDIGEVRREVRLGSVRLSDIVLTGFAYTADTLGN